MSLITATFIAIAAPTNRLAKVVFPGATDGLVLVRMPPDTSFTCSGVSPSYAIRSLALQTSRGTLLPPPSCPSLVMRTFDGYQNLAAVITFDVFARQLSQTF